MTRNWQRATAVLAALVFGQVAHGDTTILDENFDSYADQSAFEAVWPEAVNAAWTELHPYSALIPGTIGTPPNDNPPGLQGQAVNLAFRGNVYSGPATTAMATLQPTATEAVKLSADFFDDLASANKRLSVGLRNSSSPNIIEMGFYNAAATDPTDGVTVLPARHYAYRAVLFGPVGEGIIQEPSWQYFELDPALDREDTEGGDQDDITTLGDIGSGWHRYSVTVREDSITFELDLFRDGVTNLTRDEGGAIEIGVGDPGVDASQTWNISPQDAPFDMLRIGTPSFISNPNEYETVVDNILLETVDLPGGAENANFDGVGTVDGADFLTWQRNYGIDDGSALLADGDANGDGNVNEADLPIWQSQFGTTPATPVVSAVPEPSTIGLAAACLAALGLIRKRS